MEHFYVTELESMTLEEGIRKHYLLNPQFTVWREYKSDNAKKLVKAHDVSHLVFGCDTSLLGEMRVQLWAKFGVQKFKFMESLTYARDKEARVLLKNPVGYLAMAKFFLKNFEEIGKVRKRSRLMAEKWVYFDEDSYMTTTVGSIRKRFGISVI